MHNEKVDVAIVGGGPAGLTLALALVRADAALVDRVIVLEKAAYPRDKYCAGAIGGRGDKILASLDARPDVPSVPIDGMSFSATPGSRVERVPGIGRVIRRIEFDHTLAKTVRARGVRVVDGARVDAVDARSDGATVRTANGDFDAKVVVGCDGVGSVVRKAMGLGPGKLRAQVLELDTDPVASDGDGHIIHFDTRDRGFSGYIWDFPTLVDGRAQVCRGIYHLRLDDQDVDIHARLAAYLSKKGLDIARSKNKRFAERGLEKNEELSKGPVLLAGEAAGIDPVTGEGIAQAIEYGALAGAFIADALRGGCHLSEWTSHVRKSRLGIDLRVRRNLIESFYGRRRPQIEELLLSSPSALRAGAQHFGALPVDRSALADLALRAGRSWLKDRFAGMWRQG